MSFEWGELVKSNGFYEEKDKKKREIEGKLEKI